MTDIDREELSSDERRELLGLLLQTDGNGQAPEELGPVPRDQVLPLSFAQERMWIAEKLSQAGSAGASTTTMHVRGPLDVERLALTITEIARRHEALRTRFPHDPKAHGPVQVIDPPAAWDLPVEDLSVLGADERTRALEELLREELGRTLDVERGPLAVTRLVKLASDHHVLVVSAHHIILDGWSMGVVLREMGEIYTALAHGRVHELPEPPVQFADYSAWQRRTADSPETKREVQYWTQRLGSPLPVLELPTDRPRSAVRKLAGGTRPIELSVALSDAIKEFCRVEGVTPFMVLLAGFKALLHRCTGQEDLLVGSPVAGRNQRLVEPLIGCFMQPIVLRSDLSGDPCFRELVGRIRTVCFDAYAHQEVPFELIVRALHPRWNGAHTPLFQVLFNVLQEKLEGTSFDGVSVADIEHHTASAGLDLSVHLVVGAETIHGELEYSTELFDAATIDWLSRRFEDVLREAVAAPASPLSELVLRANVEAAETPERRELLRLLMEQQGEALPAPVEPGEPGAPGREETPLSFGQERLWLLDRMESESSSLIQCQIMRLTGPLDESCLQRAWDTIVQRHDIIRTAITEVDGVPSAKVVSLPDARIPVEDLQHVEPTERERLWRERASEQGSQPFDLSAPPFVRLTLVRLGPTEHVLLLAVHHIMADGWSLAVFRNELSGLYRAFRAGKGSPLPELPMQYGDYVAWQRRTYREAIVDGHLAYWMRELGGSLPSLALPADSPRSRGLGPQRKGRRHFDLSPALSKSLRELGDGEGATLFMTLLAVFVTLLKRYSGEEDLIVDTPVAGRTRREHESLLGFFVNSLALRIDASGAPTFRELLQRVRTTCLEAYSHQEIPIDRVVSRLRHDSERRGRGLTPVSFMLHEALTNELDLGEGLQLVAEEVELRDEFDLTLVLWRGPKNLSGEVHFDADQFEPATIDRLVGHWESICTALVEDAEQTIDSLPLLREAELADLDGWNATGNDDRATCVHRLFEEQASRTPDAVAVSMPPSTSLTYAELDERANRLAHRLRAVGAGPEVRVGLCVERSPEMLVGMLAILKSGAAYVAMDPGLPEERFTFLFEDAQLSVMVTQKELAPGLPTFDGSLVDIGDETLAEESSARPDVPVHPESAAYVIYTSGSSGRPKGVVVEHRNVVNHNRSVAREFELTATDRVLQFHSIGFDAAVEEIFPTWSVGATLVVRGPELIEPGTGLPQWIRDEGLTVLNLPTAYWHEWVLALERSDEAPPEPLRLVIVGGDKVAPQRFASWRRLSAGRVRWLDTYGPTEGTVVATVHDPSRVDEDAPLSIGRAIANVQAHVLDAALQRVPIGVAGELCLGGAGVARGYLARPELTADRFVPDPYGEPGARLYRTGDRVRWRAGGELEFLGRVDSQLKLRGFRIEPGEIESVLQEHPSVAQAVVRPWEDAETGDKHLAAYIVPTDPSAESADLAAFIRTRLPSYMVPSAFVTLEVLPKTSTGKVDRNALPDPGPARAEGDADYVEPRTTLERQLTEIWSDVLRVPRVGVTDDFFELGGDSLLVMRVVSRAAEAGVELSIEQVFHSPTIEEIARTVDGATPAAPARPLERVPPGQPLPLSFVQERMWITSRLTGVEAGALGSATLLQGALDVDALERAFAEILRRHDILRTTYRTEEGVPRQIAGSVPSSPVEFVDLSHLPAEQAREEAEQRTRALSLEPMNLEQGPLFRAALFRIRADEHMFATAVHHILMDGWSTNVLSRETGVLYEAFHDGRPSPLPELRVQYGDYAAWQRASMEDDEAKAHIAYWRRQLGGNLPVLELPFDRPRSSRRSGRGNSHSFRFSRDLIQALEAFGRTERVTLFMSLLTGFKVALNSVTAQEDLVIGSPVANRKHVELEELVGCFMHPIVLRTDLSGDPSLREALQRVRSMCTMGYAHQDAPFEVVVRELRPQWDGTTVPLFQAVFDMEWGEIGQASMPGLDVTPVDLGRQHSTLDMSVHMYVSGEDVHGLIEYPTDLFDEATILWLTERFQHTLQTLVDAPDRTLSQLSFAKYVERKPEGASSARQELLRQLLEESSSEDVPNPAPSLGDQRLPLSFGQERLWFLEALDPGSGTFNELQAIHIDGPLNVEALRDAWNELIKRHEGLRTGFIEVEGRPQQVISTSAEISFELIDHANVPEADREERLLELAKSGRVQPFDLQQPPLVRVTLVRYDDEDHAALVTTHHMVIDGGSTAVIQGELAALYTAYVSGQPSPLAPLELQYRDYAVRQREQCQGVWKHEQEAYWKNRLRGPLPVLELPGRLGNLEQPADSENAQEKFVLPADVLAGLKRLGQENGATLFMTLLSVFKVLLKRYTGQEDILIDTPVSGRTSRELEGLVGFFVNSLALRSDLSDCTSFRDVLHRVRTTCLDAYQHQELPYDHVIAAVRPKTAGQTNGTRSTKGTMAPLTPIGFMLDRMPAQIVQFGGLTLRTGRSEQDDELDLTLYMWEGSDSISGSVKYDASLFDRSLIQRMTEHFAELARNVIVEPDASLHALGLLTEGERTAIAAWNETGMDLPALCMHGPFEAQVSRTPDALAARLPVEPGGAGKELTYAELNAQANQLAHRLRKLGAGPEVFVGLCSRHSTDHLVGILGILKAGAAYVPLDPAWPGERHALLIEDAGLQTIVTDAKGAELCADFGSAIVRLDDATLGAESDADPDHALVGVTPKSPAYVIYTSGSTGRPKGVVVEHRSVVNHNLAMVREFGLKATDRVLHFNSISFDAAIEQIFPTLAAGATIIVRGAEVIAPGEELAEWIVGESLTMLNLPTAYWHEWVIALERGIGPPPEPLRLVAVGGEAVSNARFASWRVLCPERVRWLNTYGPTEGTIIGTVDDPVREGPTAPQTIGRPIENVRTYILDVNQQPVPVGVAGELCLAGVGVARGYLNRPELTAERFVRDPFAETFGEEAARMYRTGDRARWLPDGRIEFLGRVDAQIKLRGFRIEPGEVEAVLEKHPDVEQAVVRAWTAPDTEEKRLVAYVVPARLDSVDHAELSAFVGSQLPNFMVPSAFVALGFLPKMTTGKVDRAALPEPDFGRVDSAEEVAPRTPTEEVLANIWAQVLNLDSVGVKSGFFELGGHSLKASEVMYRLRESFAVDLPLATLFEASTIEALAHAVDEALATGASGSDDYLPAVGSFSREGRIPLSYAQEGAWFLDQLQPGMSFNIPLSTRIEGPFDPHAFEAAMQAVVARQAVLRTTFSADAEGPIQIVADELVLDVPIVDLSGFDDPGTEAVSRVLEEARSPFDLEHGPLIRAGVFRLGPDDHIVLINLYHGVFDGWSVNVLLRELAAHYGRDRLEPSSLPALPVQYMDYAIWQRRVLVGDFLEAQLDYWREQLADSPTGLDLAADTPSGATQSDKPSSGLTMRELSPELSESLRALARDEDVTLFMLLLGGFKALLMRYSGQEDLVIGTPIANRNQTEMADVIGFCVNVLALRTQLDGEPTFQELLGRVREVCLGAYRHQDLPFGLLVQHLHPERTTEASPILQVQFALQPAPAEVAELPGMRVRPIHEGGGLPEALREHAAEISPATDHLFLQAVDTGSSFNLVMHHRSDLFGTATVERMLEHMAALLEGAVATPDRSVWDLPILSIEERSRLLTTWSTTGSSAPEYVGVHHGFERSAARTPDALALKMASGGGEQLTYAELDARANQLAHRLRALGVGQGNRVAICVPRSASMLVGVLGILKAGAAYVPLDPHLPEERLALVLEDSTPAALVTEGVPVGQLADYEGNTVCLERDAEQLSRESTDSPGVRTMSEDPAYLIYTSGSTGRPKGVIVPHASVVNHNLAMRDHFGLTPADRALQFHSISFDAAVEEIFPTWSAGGTVVVRGEAPLAPGRELNRMIEAEGITVVNIPTAYWHEWMIDAVHERESGSLPELPESLRLVIVGGDAPAPERFTTWGELARGRVRWVNTYGPTEATVVCTLDEPPPADASTEPVSGLPIGRPIANTQVYVLDKGFQPVPTGAPGELFIGGRSVATGYHGRPELTAARFVNDPFSNDPDARMYRTGDRVRFLPDGRLQFLGRVDGQVKIRGFRIEPGEIANVLEQHPLVDEAVVVALGESVEEKYLVAYAVLAPAATEDEAGPDTLRSFLEGKLPAYMLPSVVMVLDELPRTPGGKVDRRALPAPTNLRPELAQAYVAPRTPSETELARLWGEVLGVDRVGIHDNFFALGGHSLLAAKLITRLRGELRTELPLLALFEHPTVAGLAAVVDTVLAGEMAQSADLDLAADALLDDEITPCAGEAIPTADASSVFLTGATGFLGSFLLRDLLETTEADVYCLVGRVDTDEAGVKRLQSALESHGIWQDRYLSRIVPVIGNLELPRLGLTQERFDELASELDVIYHNGAWVNFIYPYATLKAANVDGTAEILRLACTTKVKPVHYVSTASILGIDEHANGLLPERTTIEQWKELVGGYPQSKWVGERMVNYARERGLPVTIHRPGRVTADSVHGSWGKDPVLLNMLQTLLQLGSLPRVDTDAVLNIDLVPVNFVSEAIVALSKQPDSIGKAFHIVNPAPAPWREMLDCLRGFGYTISEVELQAFANNIFRFVRNTPTNYMHPMLSFVPPPLLEALERGLSEADSLIPEPDPDAPGALNLSCENMLAGLAGLEPECDPAIDLFQLYVTRFIDNGELEAPQEEDASGEEEQGSS